jgi:hypothetical protein
MKMIDESPFGRMPTFHMHLRAQQACFPAMFNVDGHYAVGNSSGGGPSMIVGGYGEYIERYHFYNEVQADTISIIDDLSTQKMINTIKKSSKKLKDHAFNLTKSRRLFSDESCYQPTALISLGQDSTIDREFIPFIDSCGQAAHTTKYLCEQSALYEFIERQALVGSWLSGTANFSVTDVSADSFAELGSVVAKLQEHGSLSIFSVGEGLPGYSIIIFYFSNSINDTVRYSVGMASHANSRVALEKAIHELWQSYWYLYLNENNAENLDQRFQYLNDLLHFNNHHTRLIIPYFASVKKTITLDTYLQLPDVNEHHYKHALQSISQHIFIYEGETYFQNKKYDVAKIFSPDFFIHMGVKMPLNFDNCYAQYLGIDPFMHVSHSIPFP